MGQAQVQGGSGVGQRKPCYLSYKRQQSVKVVVDVPDQRTLALEEPDTKQIDSNQVICKDQGQNWETGPYLVSDSYGKPLVMIKNTFRESATKTADLYGCQAMMLETVAAVPGMVGGLLLHCSR